MMALAQLAETSALPRSAAERQQKLNILHVLAPARVGGLEQVVIALASGHRALGHNVHVAAVLSEDEAGHPFVAALREAGISAHVAVVSVRDYAGERAFIRGLCVKLHADIVHTHGYRPDVVDSGVARGLGIATVSTTHGFIGNTMRGRFYEWFQKRWLRRLDAVVAVSRPQVELLARAGVPRERLHHLPNAWGSAVQLVPAEQARARLQIPKGAFHIGWVGRLSAEKGPDVLLSALAHLKDVPLVVSFIGDGSERAALEAKAASRGETRVRFHGFLAGAAELYRAFDAFVLSSHTEGTPIALLEAMSAGIPIVTTAVGGVPDVVTEREALLVAAGDAPALAAAIRRVRERPEEAASRVAAATERLERNYAREPWLAAYESLYRSISKTRDRS